MIAPEVLYETQLSSLTLRARGKVRDVYDVDDRYIVIVATDRLSAFDVILPDPVPGKGKVLTAVSNFWFNRLQHIVPNHLSGLDVEQVVHDAGEAASLQGRAVVVRKLRALPVEAVVRGYLSGSGWKDYLRNGSVCGVELPKGLRQADKLPAPVFTPSTKAALGAHDENIDFDKTVVLLGQNLAEQMRDISLQLYTEAAEYALQRGIIIADTKFEFGLDEYGQLVLIDEALTPDSSRFWPLEQYRPGISPPSFDKQFVRDYLETLDWNKQAPGPHLPQDILLKTAEKYREAEKLLTSG
jgi:phosphoribosylaminoimidazole-succinocarboxamide synthase